MNHALKKYKQQVKENLTSEQGIYHRKKRFCDVEPVFGNIKNNHRFKRFMLRSKPKVEIEAGYWLWHNLRKKTNCKSFYAITFSCSSLQDSLMQENEN